MAIIYKITNNVNGKVYIGKTVFTIEKRWREHLQDSGKTRCEKRPLYEAMRKYGRDNFSIEPIEECKAEEASTAEQYWINKYRSYIGFEDCNGYNATLGGDSKHYADYNWIYELWCEGKTNKEIHNITNYDQVTIMAALEDNGITAKDRQKRGNEKKSIKVVMLDKKTEEPLMEFPSFSEASLYVTDEKNGGSHISEVCRGKRKSAYGYKWKYKD